MSVSHFVFFFFCASGNKIAMRFTYKQSSRIAGVNSCVHVYIFSIRHTVWFRRLHLHTAIYHSNGKKGVQSLFNICQLVFLFSFVPALRMIQHIYQRYGTNCNYVTKKKQRSIYNVYVLENLFEFIKEFVIALDVQLKKISVCHKQNPTT